jgi:hypothetical protein
MAKLKSDKFCEPIVMLTFSLGNVCSFLNFSEVLAPDDKDGFTS